MEDNGNREPDAERHSRGCVDPAQNRVPIGEQSLRQLHALMTAAGAPCEGMFLERLIYLESLRGDHRALSTALARLEAGKARLAPKNVLREEAVPYLSHDCVRMLNSGATLLVTNREDRPEFAILTFENLRFLLGTIDCAIHLLQFRFQQPP